MPFGWFDRPSKDSGFSFVVFHDKVKRTPQGNLLGVSLMVFCSTQQSVAEFVQDDFCRLVGDSGCLGWDSGVGSDCFPLDPEQGRTIIMSLML